MPASACAIRDAVAAREVSAVEVCRAALDRIASVDAALHAFLAVDARAALERAAEVDARPDLRARPLAGVPVALKDNLCTRRLATTAASKLLEGYEPPYDATAVERLREAGAVIVGKTNCDEFAMGSSTENSAYGLTRNPWALDRTPGGSSGGSAAAVAARAVPLALGSDTGGSVRQPAGFCGVVGFKPTYGRVSRYGLIAFASSLDQIGPIATTVADAAACLSVIAGRDARDSTCAPGEPEDFSAALSGDVRGIRLGVPRALVAEGSDPDVISAFNTAIDALADLGARIVDVSLPHSAQAIAVYYLLTTAEASSNLARYDGVRYGGRAEGATLAEMYERTRGAGFGLEVKRRVILGTYVLSAGYYDAYYVKAQQVRSLIRHDYDTAFERVDAIAVPTSPTPAFPLGERIADPIRMYLADVFTVGANLAGLPAVSVPCGFSGPLPLGLQLVGPVMQDARVLAVAHAYERVTPWSSRAPAIPLR